MDALIDLNVMGQLIYEVYSPVFWLVTGMVIILNIFAAILWFIVRSLDLSIGA